MKYYGIYQFLVENNKGVNLLIGKAEGANSTMAIHNFLVENVKPEHRDFKKGYLTVKQTSKEHFAKDDSLIIATNRNRLGVWF